MNNKIEARLFFTMKSRLFCCHRCRKKNCRVLTKSKVYLLVGLALALTIVVNIGEVSHHVKSRWHQRVAYLPRGDSSNISDQFEVGSRFQMYVPVDRTVPEASGGYFNNSDDDWSNYGRNGEPEVEARKEAGTESLMNSKNVTLTEDGMVSNRRNLSGAVQPVKDTPLEGLTPSPEWSTPGPRAQRTLLDKQTRQQEAKLGIKNLTAATMGSSGVAQKFTSTTQPHPTTTSAATKPTTAATTKPATEAKTKPSTAATTKPATVAITKPATAATTKPATAATTKPATAATTKPATSFSKADLVEKTVWRNCSDAILSQLVGRFQPPMKEATEEEIRGQIPDIQIGGTYEPTDCASDEKTAIIIPYRDRWHHLHILMPVLLPMLIRQKVTFTLFIVAQDPPETFNKGLLFNAGFLEALKLDNFTCFILHDVDMIPADDRNLYRCDKNNPTHFGVSIDKFKFKLPYYGLFGGVTAFTREQFQRINGASNMYFGWGAEDDDLRERVLNKQYKMARKSPDIAVYYMVKHNQKEAGWEANSKRNMIFKMARQRQDIDGLNSVVYRTSSIKRLPLYTWINVGIDEAQVLRTVPLHLRESETVQRVVMNAHIHGFLPNLHYFGMPLMNMGDFLEI
ncbi:unnamed protein product [Lymnaea stagnalis]|uniref:Beta-1,4-N-acetylgalactosaminyltransferase bre-4 n=1 Tax=Lymnaea stagnalis TaxID=6523 RepID=A0AAV2HE74_LYMST